MTPDLEELKKLAEAATQGEWSCGRDPSHFDAPELVKPDGAFYVGVKMEDAAFIAAANPAAILALIERCERAEAERFNPIGDNHHNAMKCPHCNPDGKNARAAAFAEAIEAVKAAPDLEYSNHGMECMVPPTRQSIVNILTSLKDKPLTSEPGAA